MKSRKPITCLFSSSYIVFIFFGLVIFLSTDTVAASYDGNETDHQALLSFKSMLRYPYGSVLSSWNDSFHFCDWSGISCGKRNKRVTVIKLKSQGLEGSLSPHVGNLSFLRVLWVWNNSLQGTLPHELGHLSRLRTLVLARNKFHGVIPSNLSGCSELKTLRLAFNKLVGSIPKEIGSLSKLSIVSIEGNHLSGGIPPFLGNLTLMEVFSIAENPLGGSIPDTLGRWKSLTEIDAGSCELYGTIPHFIYNLSHLSYLSLPFNHLTGSLHPTTGSMLPNLLYLQLTQNQLTGIIPPFLSNCSKLQLIELMDNKFTGMLAIDFSKLKDITEVTLYNNNLSGSGEADDMKFIDSLKNCSSFQVLGLYNCNLKGVLPVSIFNLSDQFYYLDLGANQLYGSIHSSVCNLVGLTTLYLGDNGFTGTIPSTIGVLRKLEILSLEKNQLSGSIPDGIGNLSSLYRLYLDSNRLEGNIPSRLGNCHQLLELSFSNNKLSGKIPKQLLEISSLSVRLDLSHNQLSGSLPSEVGNLKMLTMLDLSDNNLSGNVPSTLGACTSLSFLSLEGNLFEGMIPSAFKSLRGVTKLDLSHNNLSGLIPQFLEEFLLELLDLSFNDFEGEVPVLGIFANTSGFSVLSNRRLCGGLVELGLPKCKEKKMHKKKFPLFVIAILIASALFTILCLVCAWFKKKSKEQTSQSSRKEQFLKVSYNQLLKATDGFSEANLIGMGGFSSVYKGILDDGEFVAVKVLRLQNRRAYKSFLSECEVWRNIRHRNLLKIVTSCSSVDFQGNDFKALVYEFMSNGSLHDWLHSSAVTSRLNLLQRINILLDVAHALDYLHNHCIPAIVHGDLKPSNILLDDDMVAHVGDFGLARFLGNDLNHNSSTSVKGTIGYAPPEYGLGSEMTSSGDVYSFGILLLEVMTGKKPTEDIFNEGLSIHTFAYMALPDHVTDVIDNEVIVLQSTEAKADKMEECLASTLKIGVTCSLDSPPQRMNIKDVAHELQHIKDMLQSI